VAREVGMSMREWEFGAGSSH